MVLKSSQIKTLLGECHLEKWNIPNGDHYLLKMAESQFKDFLLFMVLCLWQSATRNRSNFSRVETVHLKGNSVRKSHLHTLHSLLRLSCFCVCFAPGLEAESGPWTAACVWPGASSVFQCPLAGNWSFLVVWKQKQRMHVIHTTNFLIFQIRACFFLQLLWRIQFC